MALIDSMADAESAKLVLTAGFVFFGDEALGVPVGGSSSEVGLPSQLLRFALPRAMCIDLGAGEVLLDSSSIRFQGAGVGVESGAFALPQAFDRVGRARGVCGSVDEFLPRLVQGDRLGGKVAQGLVLLGTFSFAFLEAFEVEFACLLAASAEAEQLGDFLLEPLIAALFHGLELLLALFEQRLTARDL